MLSVVGSVLVSLVIAQAPQVEALSVLKKKFAGHKSFKVEFTQIVDHEVFLDQLDKATGSIEVKKPHYLNWVYKKPSPRSITYNGKNLVIKEGGEEQTINPAGGLSLQESFSFLWGEPNSKVFKVVSLKKNEFRVVPLNKDAAQFKYIDVKVAKGFVQQAVVHDHLDGQSLLKFHGWKLR
jgi:outer membrane lipoprotein-sorting protein